MTAKTFKFGTTTYTHDETGINIEVMLKEKPFAFEKSNIPPKLLPLLEEIENNEKSWKSLYMGVWGFANFNIKPKHQYTVKWTEKMPWLLPASKEKYVIYSPEELYNYLTSKDKGITIGQLITMFMLLEQFLLELNKSLLENNIKNAHIIKDVSKNFNLFSDSGKMFDFLEKNSLASKGEIAELNLAKETRNSFIHNGGLIQQKWCDVYYPTRKPSKNKYKPGENVPLSL